MFTTEFVARLVAMAGPSFLWTGIPGAGRPSGGRRGGGSARVGMRMWLHRAQQGLCPTCGTEVHPTVGSDLAHVVGSGPNRGGWVPGNIYLSHASCNVAVARQAWEYGAVESTRKAHLDAIARYVGAEFTTTLTNESGYSLILTPSDFARPDVIATDWDVPTVGKFNQFDPEFTG